MSCRYNEDILRDQDVDDGEDNGAAETGLLALRLSIGQPTASVRSSAPAGGQYRRRLSDDRAGKQQQQPTSAEAASAGRVPAMSSSPARSTTMSSSSAAAAHNRQYFCYRPTPPPMEKMEMMMSSAAAAEAEADRVLMSIGGEEGDVGGVGSRKKLRLTKEQSALLEERFKEHTTLNPKQKQTLAKQLNLQPRQVEVWFQNRRARTKLKQTEMDYEFLKRCCETLTGENRRLQRELHELKSLNQAAPHQFIQKLPSAAAAATAMAVCHNHTCDLSGGHTSSVASSTRTRRE